MSDYRPGEREETVDWLARSRAAEDEYNRSLLRDYDPIHPQGIGIRTIVRRAWAVILAVFLASLKFGAFMIKFFGIFISVGGYTLIWGWRFAVGIVVLILIHEMGHYLEARRQGLKPSLPVFVPFLGAYVAIKDAPRDPWRNGLISLAGPFLGGLGAFAFWGVGEAIDSRLLVALAYSGFLLNLVNLLPIRPLDGGLAWGAVRALYRTGDDAYEARGRGKTRAMILGALYVGFAVTFALAMYGSHVSQDRL